MVEIPKFEFQSMKDEMARMQTQLHALKDKGVVEFNHCPEVSTTSMPTSLKELIRNEVEALHGTGIVISYA